jgi:hypothetical protein
MGLGFFGPNQLFIKRKEVHFSLHLLCHEMGGGKGFIQRKKNTVEAFPFEEIITRFRVPREIVTDQGTHFTSKLVQAISQKYLIKIQKSSPYYPHANG